jgi:arginase family enzyme
MDPDNAGPKSVTRYEWEPSYVGIQTFLKLPLSLTPADLKAGEIDVAIGGIPWDGTNTARAGTHLGPQGIRRCDNAWSPPLNRPSQMVRVDPFDHLKMTDYGDAEVVPGNPVRTQENIERFVGEILGAGAMPILLGGDHWITWPNVKAFAEHYGAGNVAVIHFDAHSDTAPVPDDGGVGNHGTAVRQLIESGAVKAEDFIQIGMRGNWPDPTVTAWMEEQGIKVHYMAEILARGFDTVLEDVIAEAKASSAEHVFLTLDIDAVDPAFAPGTGPPGRARGRHRRHGRRRGQPALRRRQQHHRAAGAPLRPRGADRHGHAPRRHPGAELPRSPRGRWARRAHRVTVDPIRTRSLSHDEDTHHPWSHGRRRRAGGCRVRWQLGR